VTGERAVLIAARGLLVLLHPRLVRHFAKRLGYAPDPACPRTYNEKLLWRKLIDRDRRFVALSDKLASKDYARARCPDLAIPRTLWAGEDPGAIPEAVLSGDVVVKTSHGFDFNIFIANGQYDRARLVRTLRTWLRTSHGKTELEWAYIPIVPRVFVEEQLPLADGDAPTDIKVHACDGEVVHGWAVNKKTNRAVTIDRSGAPIAPAADYASDEQALPVGAALRERFAGAGGFARRLSEGIDYARYDFLVAHGRPYFSEITVYPAAGYDRWTDPAIADKLTRSWDLRRSAFLMADHRGLAGLYARALRSHLDRVDPR